MDLNIMRKKLNKIKLSKCEDIKVGDMLYFDFMLLNSFQKKNLPRSFFRIIYYSLFCSFNIKTKGDPKIISLFHAGTRKDHKKAFFDVINLLDDNLIVTPIESKAKLSLLNLSKLYLPFIWVHEMKTVTKFLYIRWIAASLIYKAYVNNAYIERIINSKKYSIKYLLSYYDTEPFASFVTQKFNKKGIKTITLQHGYFDLSWNSWSYAGSKSKYFLADSPSSAENAKKTGYSGKVISVGSPHQLNDVLAPLSNNQQIKRIGIIMNASDFGQDDNISMIQCLQKYATDKNIKLILKFHPQNNPEDYSQYIDNDIVEVVDKKESIDDFCKRIDLAIICASTVFTTMLKKGIPVLLFVRDGHDIQLFDKTDKFKFRNAFELSEKIKWINSSGYRKEYEIFQNYFLCPGNYKENYLRFFKEIGMI